MPLRSVRGAGSFCDPRGASPGCVIARFVSRFSDLTVPRAAFVPPLCFFNHRSLLEQQKDFAEVRLRIQPEVRTGLRSIGGRFRRRASLPRRIRIYDYSVDKRSMADPQPPARTRGDEPAAGHDMVVIGASAGGAAALSGLLAQLPGDLPAAVLVTCHLSPASHGLLPVLHNAGALAVKHGENGEPIRCGTVYLAPPDRHLMVSAACIRITRGPRENRWRPAIDPLFRSAAVSFGPRVIGVVLTGMLDDGTAGLAAIKRCGGIAVVQDPLDAAHPEMPQSALDNVVVDHRAPMSQLGSLIERLVAQAPGPSPVIPLELEREAEVSERGAPARLEDEPRSVGFICPECGGPLNAHEAGGLNHYRCMVGHGWSPGALLSNTSDALESTLWAAIRLFRQRANLLVSMAKRQRDAGHERMAVQYERSAQEAMDHAQRLQQVAMGSLDLSDRSRLQS